MDRPLSFRCRPFTVMMSLFRITYLLSSTGCPDKSSGHEDWRFLLEEFTDWAKLVGEVWVTLSLQVPSHSLFSQQCLFSGPPTCGCFSQWCIFFHGIAQRQSWVEDELWTTGSIIIIKSSSSSLTSNSLEKGSRFEIKRNSTRERKHQEAAPCARRMHLGWFSQRLCS